MLTIGSLFSGIGGLELGLEWAGLGPVLWQVEKDPYCLKVLEKHWPDVRRYDDVKTISGAVAPVDLICGGFPCQDISCAGRGAGIKDGTRSGLWFEFARVICELRPRFVVVENVPALLTRGMDIVLGDLAALGYDAWWDCIPAQAVGAPHRRDRVFIVGYTNDKSKSTVPVDDETPRMQNDAADANITGRRLQQEFGPEFKKEAIVSNDGTEGALADTDSKRPHTQFRNKSPKKRQKGRRYIGRSCDETRNQWSTEPAVGRVADGVPNRVHRLRALGNAVVPQVAEVIGEIVKELAHDFLKKVGEEEI